VEDATNWVLSSGIHTRSEPRRFSSDTRVGSNTRGYCPFYSTSKIRRANKLIDFHRICFPLAVVFFVPSLPESPQPPAALFLQEQGFVSSAARSRVVDLFRSLTIILFLLASVCHTVHLLGAEILSVDWCMYGATEVNMYLTKTAPSTRERKRS